MQHQQTAASGSRVSHGYLDFAKLSENPPVECFKSPRKHLANTANWRLGCLFSGSNMGHNYLSYCVDLLGCWGFSKGQIHVLPSCPPPWCRCRSTRSCPWSWCSPSPPCRLPSPQCPLSRPAPPSRPPPPQRTLSSLRRRTVATPPVCLAPPSRLPNLQAEPEAVCDWLCEPQCVGFRD